MFACLDDIEVLSLGFIATPVLVGPRGPWCFKALIVKRFRSIPSGRLLYGRLSFPRTIIESFSKAFRSSILDKGLGLCY